WRAVERGKTRSAGSTSGLRFWPGPAGPLADVATQRKTGYCAAILCVGNEAQCHAVVAESLAGGIGTIEDVTMMAPAVRGDTWCADRRGRRRARIARRP